MHFQMLDLFIKTCVPFQIIPIQLNLPQVNFTQRAVTFISKINAYELNFNYPRYGYEYLCNGIIYGFLSLIHLQMLKTCYLLCHYTVWSVD